MNEPCYELHTKNHWRTNFKVLSTIYLNYKLKISSFLNPNKAGFFVSSFFLNLSPLSPHLPFTFQEELI